MMAMQQFAPPPVPNSTAPDGASPTMVSGLPYSPFMNSPGYPASSYGLPQPSFPSPSQFGGGGSQLGGFGGPPSNFGFNPYAQSQPPSQMFGQMNLGGEHEGGEGDGTRSSTPQAKNGAGPTNIDGAYGHESRQSQ